MKYTMSLMNDGVYSTARLSFKYQKVGQSIELVDCSKSYEIVDMGLLNPKD